MGDHVIRVPCFLLLTIQVLAQSVAAGGEEDSDKLPPAPTAHDGYRGIWYMNKPLDNEYKFKYSGGMATYPQQHIPIAIYSEDANKTFFCYGGTDAEGKNLFNMVSFYDHATGRLPRPVAVLERKTNDAHFNPTLALDAAGHVYVFCNSHGDGSGLPADDPTRGMSYIFRSKKPYSIDEFDCQAHKPFSYSQVWNVKSRGLLWLHTRYANNERKIHVSTSGDGLAWSKPSPMIDIEKGSYQISTSDGENVVTAFDVHPKLGGLNARTNLYFLQSADFGKTWTTAAGEKVELPLRDMANPALVHDYQSEELLVYLKDIVLDIEYGPVILFLTSRGFEPGPESGPRTWNVARWNGNEWIIKPIFKSDHNYDHGSLYIEPDGTWRVIAPLLPGRQPDSTGGRIGMYESINDGFAWRTLRVFGWQFELNDSYVRRPQPRHDGFYALWANGDALEPSPSDLFISSKQGGLFRLPRTMEGDWVPGDPRETR